MAKNGHYRKLVEKQENKDDSSDSDSASTEADETHEIEENEEMGAEGEEIFDTVDLEPIDDQTATPHFSFKNCSFSYPTRPDRKILDSFNLAVRQGETLALVGPSGGGKWGRACVCCLYHTACTHLRSALLLRRNHPSH